MTWSLALEKPQAQRVALVTGANSGLGYRTALELAKLDFTVILACRNLQKAEKSRLQIIAASDNEKLHCLALDLGSQQAVKQSIIEFRRRFSRLDLLINNAGIMMPPFTLTEEGFESQFAANYLGHFSLSLGLLDVLEATPGSRIISLSSLAHQTGKIHFDDLQFQKNYHKIQAYGQSKLACLIFAIELQRRLSQQAYQTRSVAAHPGIASTNLDQHLSPIQAQLFKWFSQPEAKGALPILFAALSEDIHGGEYCGPKGFFQARGEPGIVKAKKHAYDETIASKLWELSEQFTGFKFPAVTTQ